MASLIVALAVAAAAVYLARRVWHAWRRRNDGAACRGGCCH